MLPRALYSSHAVRLPPPPALPHTFLLNDTTRSHTGTLQCLRQPPIQEEVDPFALLLPPRKNTSTTNSSSDFFNGLDKPQVGPSSITLPNADSWIEMIEPVLKILEISEPVTDPGALTDMPLGNKPALEMSKKSKYQ